jgi:magnesium-transporting ATPase (P-type)
VFFGIGMGFICDLVGFVPAAYMSMESLLTPESFKLPQSDRLFSKKQWIPYWVIFGLFSVFETFIPMILYFIPLYYAIKV